MRRKLRTIGEVIEALGGNVAVRRRTGRSPQAVTNWRARGRFPRETYLLINGDLRRLRCSAPASLWGMAEPG